MKEKLKNPKVKIAIGIIIAVILVIVGMKVEERIRINRAKKEVEKAQQQLQETLSSLTPFGNSDNDSNNNSNNKPNNREETNNNSNQQLDTNVDIEKLKNEQKLVCTSAKILIQDDEYKSLYPDMLSASIVNNSSEVVKSYTVVFLAYDENYLPVKIRGNWGKGGDYEYTCLDDEANLIAGATSKEGYGWELDDPHGITYTIACVKEAEFFNGEKWENEYYKYWLENYKGKILPENSRAGLIPYGQ